MTAYSHSLSAKFPVMKAEEAEAEAQRRIKDYFGDEHVDYDLSTQRIETVRGELLHYMVSLSAQRLDADERLT